jgi:hypothetical protein
VIWTEVFLVHGDTVHIIFQWYEDKPWEIKHFTYVGEEEVDFWGVNEAMINSLSSTRKVAGAWRKEHWRCATLAQTESFQDRKWGQFLPRL